MHQKERARLQVLHEHGIDLLEAEGLLPSTKALDAFFTAKSDAPAEEKLRASLVAPE